MTLLINDVLQGVRDFAVDAAKVARLLNLLLSVTDALQQFLDALDAISVFVGHAFSHHPTQSGVQIAVIKKVVGELLEDTNQRRGRNPSACHPSGNR